MSLSRQVQSTDSLLDEIRTTLADFPGLTLEGRLRKLATLRNGVNHEYLDLRFVRVRDFIRDEAGTIGDLSVTIRTWMEGVHQNGFSD